MTKVYKYYVSFAKQDGFGSCYLEYGEPVDTQVMIDRVQKDLKVWTDMDCCILCIKRIKGDRA